MTRNALRSRTTAIAGTAIVGGVGYALGCWLARVTSYATRRESADLGPEPADPVYPWGSVA